MFGITDDDVRVYLEIEKRGYTVKRAYELRRSGELPQDLEKILKEYEESLIRD